MEIPYYQGMLTPSIITNESDNGTNSFSILTWNVEHYGFTANGETECKPWRDNDPIADRDNYGYSESSDHLKERINRVFQVIRGIDLVGLNEIGGLAFQYLQNNYEGIEDIEIITGGKDITDDNLPNMELSLQFDSEPDFQNVYANICIINTILGLNLINK